LGLILNDSTLNCGFNSFRLGLANGSDMRISLSGVNVDDKFVADVFVDDEEDINDEALSTPPLVAVVSIRPGTIEVEVV
jgi:hypothetical protein